MKKYKNLFLIMLILFVSLATHTTYVAANDNKDLTINVDFERVDYEVEAPKFPEVELIVHLMSGETSVLEKEYILTEEGSKEGDDYTLKLNEDGYTLFFKNLIPSDGINYYYIGVKINGERHFYRYADKISHDESFNEIINLKMNLSTYSFTFNYFASNEGSGSIKTDYNCEKKLRPPHHPEQLDILEEDLLVGEFELLDDKGNFVTNFTVEAGQKLQIQLPYGSYILKQISAPEGYKLFESDIMFDAKMDKNDSICKMTIDLVNEKAEETLEPEDPTEKPEEPVIPEDPVDKEDPVKPEDPVIPEEPVDKKDPVKPDDSDIPKVKEKVKETPNTATSSNVNIYVLILSVSFISLKLMRRRYN